MEVSKLTTRDQHLAKVQLYRWYQLYERPMNDQRINNQLEMLDENITMINASEEFKGTKDYPKRLKVYDGWQNAHHIKSIEVSLLEDNSIGLEADLHYQNIKPNGEKQSYALHYNDIRLEKFVGDLPKFTRVEIVPVGPTDEDFEDAYPTNRTKSLMHFWLAHMESLDGNVSPFKELLVDNFKLHFSTNNAPIVNIDDLEKWLNGTPKQLKESSHFPENFSVKVISEKEYEVDVDFVWEGLTKENQKLTATTTHHWVVQDNPNDRFAKIKEANITQKVPLAPLK
ncbi:hypothetical protein [Zobellia galactanivorans]|uniref:Uncharacterized protein n=1 Tax=Zobellia galactanivorans (strain DSM 12802 / CCUG 47099 / CIP 106680 / NCIMB 13871 / Dsij) TaxID=63186 RepID=G0L420_ZOBGA|nr:hypothetical protein [Zobellia galactanivorans]CAZ98611.1 Hypothetical protein ZOBELLIA_4476 [Zobellia galactanivorans]